MREVISNQLWLGNAGDVGNIARLYEIGIVAVIDLALEELPPKLSRDLMYCRFPLIDGAGNAPALLLAAISTTVLLIRNYVPTLVACSAGMSRSPGILAAALAIVRVCSPDECLQQLIAGQPHDVSPHLWDAIMNAHQELAR